MATLILVNDRRRIIQPWIPYREIQGQDVRSNNGSQCSFLHIVVSVIFDRQHLSGWGGERNSFIVPRYVVNENKSARYQLLSVNTGLAYPLCTR